MPEMTYFGPLSKVTLLAGQNNVGKSNVIRFLERFLRDKPEPLQWQDAPRRDGDPFGIAVALAPNEERYEKIAANPSHKRILDLLLALPPLHVTNADGLQWLPMTQSGSRGRSWSVNAALMEELTKAVETWNHRAQVEVRNRDKIELRPIASQHVPSGAGNLVERLVRHLFTFEAPPVEVIKAFRRIDKHEEGTTDHSGMNLILTLAEHQNPETHQRDLRKKFDAINRFVSQVLEDDSVAIEVPHSRDHLLVHQGRDVFPLQDLGTGIHQTVILAAAATLLDNTLVCVEEPEVNLHPLLQRKLISYLARNTSNQYVIATHSAHMLDYENASIIHLRMTDRGTQAETATSPADVSRICTDLGYRPSDLIQANAVIWVEGPSDRIYLRHWMNLIEPDSGLVEGIHYSIMFYGGRLMSHLSANEPEAADDLISLRRINRHSMIVIDSDRTYRGKKLGSTKDRVIAEFEIESQPGHAWVTWGYTIENYVPAEELNAAVEKVHPTAVPDWDGARYTNPLKVKSSKTGNDMSADKNRIASEVCSRWTDPEILPPDLLTEIRLTLEFIRAAN